jgi:hypothetical protein
VREDPPDDRRIVQGDDQAQATPQCGHVSTSMANARCITVAQFRARGLMAPATVSSCTFSVGLSDQLQGVRVFVVVRIIRLKTLKLPLGGRGLDLVLGLLGRDGCPFLLTHWI